MEVKEKDWVYYMVDPGIYGERMMIRYEVKDWKVWRISIYNEYGRRESVYNRERKLEILKRMKESEEYGDYEDSYYESEEWFKKKLKRWKSMD